MCGIAGFASAPGGPALDRALLENMTALLEHRGPDAQDVFVDGPFGLGHRRLAIIDLAGGRNPLYDSEERVALVFNGEIYNHRELREELEAAGCRPRSASDGEVIVHGFLTWGLVGMLRKLRGMYAFALLDRVKRELHLARDPLGIKPLFYMQNSEGFFFGSEMKALLSALPSRPRLSRRGLLESVTLGFTLSPGTIYEDIHSLERGAFLTLSDGRLRHGRHHELIFEPGSEPSDPDACWEQVTRSVASHLMSEVPLGAFLSGGIDSSAVVTAMTEVSEGRIDAVSVGVTSSGLDERPFAREVAGGLGVRLHEETAESDIVDLVPRMAWHLESPFADTSAAPTWLVCEAARRHVTVALSGDGGDENFAGYRRTKYDVLEERVRSSLPASLRRFGLGPLGRAWPRGRWVPRSLRAGTLLENLGDDWLDGYLRSLSRIPEKRARALIRPEMQADDPLRASVEHHAARVETSDPLSRVQAMDFATWLTDDILVKVDRMSMAHSLEVRVPLLDTDFVEYAAGLPVESKLHEGEGKYLFKQSLRGRVPSSVLDRPKQGFHLPVGDWLAGPLAPILGEILADPSGPVFDLLDFKQASRSVNEHLSGKVDRTAEVWFVVVLDAFQRHAFPTVTS
ncbi:MAG: asparagine synthase (glutamine-hydrolyzing) [Planctomycetota bacterium]|jgi:asparagine synthase (glutamine-hydrolysing)|nr:asparagine synthase (glutamine-hydrolyzing) [Planctomycetota bacterium]